MIEPEVAELLESPCSLLVGTVSEERVPDAIRAWGVEVVADDRVRVLLPVEATVLANLAVDGRMALTTTNFLTLESWQLKGRVVAVEEASPRDRIRYDAFCAGCLEILVPLHQAPAEQIARLLPVGVVACELLVEQVFDQTPGPGAGARVAPETV